MQFKDEEAKVYLEKKQMALLDQKKELKGKYDVFKKRSDELKVILYSKFGKSIHLDDD